VCSTFRRLQIDANRKRLGNASDRVHWLVADITQSGLPPSRYDVWHDHAIFHFLTAPRDRVAYVRQVARAVRNGGYVIVSTFGPEGPTKCSGLEVVRYHAESLRREFGVHFRLWRREPLHSRNSLPATYEQCWSMERWDSCGHRVDTYSGCFASRLRKGKFATVDVIAEQTRLNELELAVLGE
jgi:hypothetical protein